MLMKQLTIICSEALLWAIDGGWREALRRSEGVQRVKGGGWVGEGEEEGTRAGDRSECGGVIHLVSAIDI